MSSDKKLKKKSLKIHNKTLFHVILYWYIMYIMGTNSVAEHNWLYTWNTAWTSYL